VRQGRTEEVKDETTRAEDSLAVRNDDEDTKQAEGARIKKEEQPQ